MQSPPRPAPREFFLHPDAKRLQALPPDQLMAQVLEQLSVQSERKVPDFERCWGLGQLAATLRVAGVEPALESWLVDHDSPNGHDAASLFLQAYWMKQSRASATLVAALVDGLDRHRDASGMRDGAVLALAAAHSRVDSTLATRIRDTFHRIDAANLDLQPSVQAALSSVIERRRSR